MIYNVDTKKCQLCPVEKPLELNGQCFPCPDNSHYDVDSGICLSCAEGSYFDKDQDKCVFPPVIKPPSCPYGQDYHKDTKTCVCPKLTPHDTGYSCLTCFSPSFWNSATKKC